MLVADRGFCSSVPLALLVQGGVPVVLRVHQKPLVDFTPGRPHVTPDKAGRKGTKGQPRSRGFAPLGQDDPLVAWCKPTDCPDWMDEAQLARLPDRLPVRALRYRVQRKGFRVKTVTLGTTLLDAQLSSIEALAALSVARWGTETHYAHLKTTMGLDVLTCTTVDGGLKELLVFALIDHLIRLVMGPAARQQQVSIDRISFIDTA